MNSGWSLADLWWPALGLMLVLEGLLPLFNPKGWREVFQRATQLGDGQVRFLGLASLGCGLLILLLLA